MLCNSTYSIHYISHTRGACAHSNGEKEEEKGQYLTVRFGYGVSGNYDMR